MKLFFLAAILTSVFCISCQKDLIDPDPVTNPGGGTNLTNCKDCIYFPVCDSTRYTYEDSTANGVETITDTLFAKGDTTITGMVFKILRSGSTGQKSFVNCTNSTTTQIASANGTIVKVRALIANLPVNGAWTDTVAFQGQQLLYKSKIVEKGISRSVLTNTFPDVIHVQSIAGTVLPGVGFTPLITSEYYFARGVGIIEVISTNDMTSERVYHRYLKSYFVP